MATYAYVTLLTAGQELSNRLYDSTQQFWSPAEITTLIVEALRTWNSLASTQRGDFTFPSVADSTWYDLTQQSNSLRPLMVTDNALIQQIEYSLLEPLTTTYPLAWTGSAQFTVDDILNAIQRRRDEVLGTTGCSISRSLLTTVPTQVRNVLADTTLDVRRIAYMPQSGLGQPSAVTLWQSDKWGTDNYQVGYTQRPAGMPKTYLLSTDPTLAFDLDTPPAYPGSFELLTVNAGGALLTTSPSTFTIPDDWTWILRWGALADLLGRESNAKDPLRSKYAEGRYRQGLQLLASAPALLGLRLANVPLQVSSVRAADAYQVGWQAQAPAQPQRAFAAGLNLLALSPTPDVSNYSLMATVVQNAPIPVNPTDYLQIPRDVYDSLLDECVHIAMFKSGGAEFMATMPLHDRFVQLAALYSSKLDEMGEFTKTLYGLSQREEGANPRYSGDLEVGAEP